MRGKRRKQRGRNGCGQGSARGAGGRGGGTPSAPAVTFTPTSLTSSTGRTRWRRSLRPSARWCKATEAAARSSSPCERTTARTSRAAAPAILGPCRLRRWLQACPVATWGDAQEPAPLAALDLCQAVQRTTCRSKGPSMKYRRLGKTGLRVSVIEVGTWQLGGEGGSASPSSRSTSCWGGLGSLAST
jgi:hypothetical protein